MRFPQLGFLQNELERIDQQKIQKQQFRNLNYHLGEFKRSIQQPFIFLQKLGNTHFLSLNLHYFNDQMNRPNTQNQQKMLEWVENDLKNVDRSRTPWVIVFGHKMVYCKGSDCDGFANDYAQFDTLLNKYQIDLFISGHKHKFQVMKPMKNGQPANYFKSSNSISNYEGFVTVIQGNGGTNKNDGDDFVLRNLSSKIKEPQLFNTVQQKMAMLHEIDNIGYGILNIIDDKNINVQSINSQTNQSVYEINLKK